MRSSGPAAMSTLTTARVACVRRSWAMQRKILHQHPFVENDNEVSANSVQQGQGLASGGELGWIVKHGLTVERLWSWRGRPATLALFWPYNNAQHRHFLRVIDEYFSRSAQEWAGSGCGRRSLRI
jgi:hypothetical protein